MTPQNRAKIDRMIHEYTGVRAEYEHCSSDWTKIGKKIKTDEKEKKKLMQAVKAALA